MFLFKTFKDKSNYSATGATKCLFLKVLPSQVEMKHANKFAHSLKYLKYWLTTQNSSNRVTVLKRCCLPDLEHFLLNRDVFQWLLLGMVCLHLVV